MTKHGGCKTKLWGVWYSMNNRCTNPKNSHYEYYGGKGISVCEEWKDFAIFRSWALGNGYKEGLSIDRIDNSKNYSPENCRWADAITQANNKSNNVTIPFRGKMMTPHQIEDITGINRRLITARLRSGWSVEDACTTPSCRSNRKRI